MTAGRRPCCRAPDPEIFCWTPDDLAIRAQNPEDVGRKGEHPDSRTQECLVTHAAGTQAWNDVEGTWVSLCKSPGPEIYGVPGSQGRYRRAARRTGRGESSRRSCCRNQLPLPGTPRRDRCTAASQPQNAGTWGAPSWMHRQLEGAKPLHLALAGPCVVWRRGNEMIGASRFLRHSLTRNREENQQSWARTREVWGAEGEEGLAYPAAPRLLRCGRNTSFPHSPPRAAAILHGATIGRSWSSGP